MKTEIRSTLIGLMAALATLLVSSYFSNYITRADFDDHKLKSAVHESQVITELRGLNKTLDFLKNELIEHLKVHK